MESFDSFLLQPTRIILYQAEAQTCISAVLPLQHKTGLPISTYFSAVKLRWLMDNVDEVRQAVLSERAMFGTVDSWIIWVTAAQSLQLQLALKL